MTTIQLNPSENLLWAKRCLSVLLVLTLMMSFSAAWISTSFDAVYFFWCVLAATIAAGLFLYNRAEGVRGDGVVQVLYLNNEESICRFETTQGKHYRVVDYRCCRLFRDYVELELTAAPEDSDAITKAEKMVPHKKSFLSIYADMLSVSSMNRLRRACWQKNR